MDVLNGLIQPVDQGNADADTTQKLFDLIYDTDNIEVKTDLSEPLIEAVTKAKMFAKTYNVSLLDDTIEYFMKLRVSKDRKGREEFTRITARINEDINEERNMFDKLIGK